MEIKRSFKGVWIPKEIWLAEDINITEKAFLAEIDSLSSTKLGCFASNKHFSKFSGLSVSRCSTIINDLERKGYVDINLVRKKNSKEIEKRYIKINYIGISNMEAGISEMKGGCFGNSEGINTKDINTSNKDIVVYKETTKDNIPYQEIISYLNEATGRNFRNVESNKRLIRARFNESYTLEDFKKVIDVKISDWQGTEYERYLQPSTLFSNKFDGYLNQSFVPRNKTREPITKRNEGSTFEHILPKD